MKAKEKETRIIPGVLRLAVVSAILAIPAFATNIFVDHTQLSAGRVIFAETLSVNESRTKTIKANDAHNWTGIKLINGQTYKFTVASPEWNNGSMETTAAGYPQHTVFDATSSYFSCSRRYPSYNWMALVGGVYSQNNSSTSYTGTAFHIGMGRTWKATKTGYLAAFANDCFIAYGDNSRVVTLTIKRVG